MFSEIVRQTQDSHYNNIIIIIKKKKTPIKKSQILSNIISNNIYNNLQHFHNDIIVQVDNGNTKTKQIQLTRNVLRRQIIQKKVKKFRLLQNYSTVHNFFYFLGTCVSKRFHSNLISKSRRHLIFTVKLSFYVLLNHGFSSENTTFSKISYKYTHQTKYFPLEFYILSTSNSNRIDHFKHKIALKHTFQQKNFS